MPSLLGENRLTVILILALVPCPYSAAMLHSFSFGGVQPLAQALDGLSPACTSTSMLARQKLFTWIKANLPAQGQPELS